MRITSQMSAMDIVAVSDILFDEGHVVRDNCIQIFRGTKVRGVYFCLCAFCTGYFELTNPSSGFEQSSDTKTDAQVLRQRA